VEFIGGLLRGDLGDSVVRDAPVRDVLGARLVPTLSILLYATAIAVALAVPLAMISARYRNRAADHAVRLGTMVTFAMPTFWLGLLGVQLFSLKLHLLPVSGYEGGLIHQLRFVTMPALTVGLYLAPVVLRTLRSSLIGVLDSDYIEAAYARGIPSGRVMRHHALRNAAIPALTVLSINLGFLVSGTVIVENVFDIPGIGTLLVDSILRRDYPVVQALTLLLGLGVVLINLAVDVFYAVIDPRVRYR
jgi:peptide/nickel transport system permease protein